MRRSGRKLTAEEAALWAKVARTVEPLIASRPGKEVQPGDGVGSTAETPLQVRATPPAPSPKRVTSAPPPRSGEDRRQLDRTTLDASWDRRLARGLVAPDFTLDLHGATLDAAYSRLEHGLALALAQGARLVVLVTGRSRPVDAADRGQRRGAIRAKFMDWLANGSHASKIAAIRPAHPRHGGAGAVYIVLKRTR